MAWTRRSDALHYDLLGLGSIPGHVHLLEHVNCLGEVLPGLRRLSPTPQQAGVTHIAPGKLRFGADLLLESYGLDHGVLSCL